MPSIRAVLDSSRLLSKEVLSQAAEALRLFARKKLSPVELMEATIRRAEALQPKVNCFTFTHYEEAMALAKKAEAKYAKGGKTGALEGLPIGIKDEDYVEFGTLGAYGIATSTMFNGYGNHAVGPVGEVFNG
jgi:Asp-tRNA(Asn)/Glu-tRNA(Gln) amidotransferase A subunit family amidase